MSTATSTVSSVPAVTYATDLAQSSALKRSLHNLGIAIQNGELAPASTILTAFFKANPSYTSASSDASPSQDPLAQDFQALATAISNNQVDAAQQAWTQIKNDFAKDGVTNLSNGASDTSQTLAQSKATTNQQILSDMFGGASGGNSPISELIGGSADSSTQSGLSSSLIENWLTYQHSGIAAPAAMPSGAANLLDTIV